MTIEYKIFIDNENNIHISTTRVLIVSILLFKVAAIIVGNICSFHINDDTNVDQAIRALK